MASPLDPSDQVTPPPERPSGKERLYRWLDGLGGVLLLIVGIICLRSSLGPYQWGSFLVSLAIILTSCLDMRRWVSEGRNRSPNLSFVLSRRWLLALWFPVFLLLLTGCLMMQMGY